MDLSIGWFVALWGLDAPLKDGNNVIYDDVVPLSALNNFSSSRIELNVLGLSPNQEELDGVDDANGYSFEPVLFKDTIELDVVPFINRNDTDVTKFWELMHGFLRSRYKYFSIYGTNRTYYDTSIMAVDTAWRVSSNGRSKDLSYKFPQASRVISIPLKKYKPQRKN